MGTARTVNGAGDNAPQKKADAEALTKLVQDLPPEQQVKLVEAVASQGDQGEATARKLLAIFDKLPPKEREKLNIIGVQMPHGLSEDSADVERPIWGYKCDNCFGVAFEFTGRKFFSETVGGLVEQPDSTMTLNQVTWTQSKLVAAGKFINRERPNCQCCGAGVVLGSPNKRLLDANIKLIESYTSELDEYFGRNGYQSARKALQKAGSGGGNDLGDGVEDFRAGKHAPASASEYMDPSIRGDVEVAGSAIVDALAGEGHGFANR